MDFRTEMQKLEKIVNDMKDENIDINEALKLYDEGICRPAPSRISAVT